jgi:hypothetical protein
MHASSVAAAGARPDAAFLHMPAGPDGAEVRDRLSDLAAEILGGDGQGVRVLRG